MVIIMASCRNIGQRDKYKLKELICAEYTAELTRKRTLFSRVCTQLYHKQLKFTLTNPATLHFQSIDGTQKTFHNHEDSEMYVDSLKDNNTSDNKDRNYQTTLVQPHKLNRQILKMNTNTRTPGNKK